VIAELASLAREPADAEAERRDAARVRVSPVAADIDAIRSRMTGFLPKEEIDEAIEVGRA
jgi:hypothetical protein